MNASHRTAQSSDSITVVERRKGGRLVMGANDTPEEKPGRLPYLTADWPEPHQQIMYVKTSR